MPNTIELTEEEAITLNCALMEAQYGGKWNEHAVEEAGKLREKLKHLLP